MRPNHNFLEQISDRQGLANLKSLVETTGVAEGKLVSEDRSDRRSPHTRVSATNPDTSLPGARESKG